MTENAADYIKDVEKIGFKRILEEPFYSSSQDVYETLYCFWNYKYSILLIFDTFTWNMEGEVPSVNGGHFYYNWIPKNMSNRSPVSSGGFKQFEGVWVWSGYHDCRTNVEWVIKDFLKHGKFKKTWIENPVHSICHSEDWHINGHNFGKDTHSSKVTKKRLKSFPIDVQIKMNAITKSELRELKCKSIFEE